jgi:hypothetical protein
MKKENVGYLLLTLIAVSVLVLIIRSAPIEQEQAYHDFSDIRVFFKIPNFWNVISNLPFLIVGLMGVYRLKSGDIVKNQFIVFFIGIALVSFGSAYYHLNPNDETLVWDRLPMTIGFMALFSALVSEFINDRMGKTLLIPALSIGLLSILYWVLIKDLSIYLAVQFFPMLTIPVMLLFFKSRHDLVAGYWLILLAYVIAKALEIYDYETYAFLGFISGHSLKHIVAALGIYMLILKRVERNELK